MATCVPLAPVDSQMESSELWLWLLVEAGGGWPWPSLMHWLLWSKHSRSLILVLFCFALQVPSSSFAACLYWFHSTQLVLPALLKTPFLGQRPRYRISEGGFSMWEVLGSSASTCYSKDSDIFQRSLQGNSTWFHLRLAASLLPTPTPHPRKRGAFREQ